MAKLERQVAAGLTATKEVYDDPAWCRWAQAWLDGIDGSRTSARVAEAAALAGRLAVSLAAAEKLRAEGKPTLAEFVEAMAADMAERACRASLSAR